MSAKTSKVGGVRVGSGRKKGSKNGVNKSKEELKELKELNRLRMHQVAIERANKQAAKHGSTLEERIAIMSVPVNLMSTQLGYKRKYSPANDSNVLPQSLHEYSAFTKGAY